MGLEIPTGDKESPELPRDTASEGSNQELFEKWEPTKSRKPFILAGVMSVLTVGALVVGILMLAGAISVGKDGKPPKSSSLVHTQEYLTLSNGPFDVSIPLFSTQATEGYSSDDEFKDDFKEVAKYLLNDAIKNSAGVVYPVENTTNTGGTSDPSFGAPNAPEMDSGAISEGTGGTEDKLAGVDAYETNNQEFTIDRADFVKSDGNFLFAAYSDRLVVFTIDGQGILSQTQMTPLNVTGYGGCGPWGPCIEPYPGEVMPMQDGESDTVASAKSSVWPGWNPKPRIEALLIHGTRLTAVVSGYGMEYTQQLGRTPVIYEYLSTRIQVYDINSGDLQLIAQTDVNGYFMNAYSNGEFVHVVTRSSINTWDHLLALIDRSQPAFQGLDDAQYSQAVTTLVDEGLLDTFVDNLLKDLQVNGPVDLARLSFFIDSISANNTDQDLYYSGLATSISQVVSLDMTAPISGVDAVASIQPHIAATFHPGSWGYVYAMGSMIIVADLSWSWIEAENRAAEKTYLVCFSLSGASSSHALVGTVDGALMSPFALDYVDKSTGSYVRVATTQTFWTPWVMVMEGDVMEVDGEAQSTSANVAASDGVATTVVATTSPESSTTNQIIVLKVPTEATGILEAVGSVELGEPNERFTAVRFFDEFAYAVTFEQTDPFYVVDLSGEQPVVSGELKVSGFSEYLHPIDSEDKLLLAIGSDADETGTILGYQISLFDATEAALPTLVDRLVVENDVNTWSSSSASWDERAFRFLPLGDATGKLIIPMSIYTYQEYDEDTGLLLETPISTNYEGFSVFNVANRQITKDFDIDHSFEIPYNESCSQWYDWLPERSFVFDGNVVTMKKYTIISTSLSTGETLWTVPLNSTLIGC